MYNISSSEYLDSTFIRMINVLLIAKQLRLLMLSCFTLSVAGLLLRFKPQRLDVNETEATQHRVLKMDFLRCSSTCLNGISEQIGIFCILLWLWCCLKSSIAKYRISTRKVQLYIRSSTDTTRAFVTALKRMFKCTDVETEFDPNVPLIALCQCSSRLQVDVDMVIQGISDTRFAEYYVLIIIHKGYETDIPRISSARQLDIEKNVIELIDMALDNDGVIYDCEVNRNAQTHLRAYIDRFKPNKSMNL